MARIVDSLAIHVWWALRWSVSPAWRFERVRQPCTTVWYVEEGVLGYSDGKRVSQVHPGSLAFIPVDREKFVWNAGENTLTYLSLGCDVMDGVQDIFALQEPIISDRPLPAPAIRHWTELIEECGRASGTMSTSDRLLFAAKVRTFWALLLEHLAIEPLAATEQLDPRVRRVIEIVQRDPAAGPRLTDLARDLHTSESHLRCLITESLRMPYRQLLLNSRIRAAKRLLMSGEMSVGEVAAAVGYRDARHFSRAFAKTEGMLPSEYRTRVLRI